MTNDMPQYPSTTNLAISLSWHGDVKSVRNLGDFTAFSLDLYPGSQQAVARFRFHFHDTFLGESAHWYDRQLLLLKLLKHLDDTGQRLGRVD